MSRGRRCCSAIRMPDHERGKQRYLLVNVGLNWGKVSQDWRYAELESMHT